MLAIKALSIAFWSAARVLLISFFCKRKKKIQLAVCFIRLQSLGVLGGISPNPLSPIKKTYLSLLSLLEESLLTGLLLSLLGGEVLWLSNLIDLLLVEAGKVDLVGGGNDVAGVDAAQRNTVDLEGASDEEDTLVERLEEDDALATEAAGEEDQDGTGLKGLSGSPGTDGLADLVWNFG